MTPLTARNQAVLATVAGILAGAAVVGGIVAFRAEPDSGETVKAASSPSPSATPSAVEPGTGALQAAGIQYVSKKFGTKTADITIEAPAGWKYVKQDAYNAWFVGPEGTWRLRVDATANARDIDQALKTRERSLARSANRLKVLGREDGVQQTNWGPGMLRHRTLVYSYQSSDRGLRYVMNRFVAIGDAGRTAVEITVSGRPEDQTGLEAVLAQATATIVLAG
jgi:hypothetical protein